LPDFRRVGVYTKISNYTDWIAAHVVQTAQSDVDPRTIQRMEAGEAVRVETLHSVAAPLGVTARDLLRSGDDASHEGPADGSGILLKSEHSGRRLIAAVLRADHLVLGSVFEPWPEQMKVVQPLIAALERLHPLTFSRPGPGMRRQS
jgi:hypothetical protein